LIAILSGLAVPSQVSAGMGLEETAASDAVVVAVIDSALNPYHWDFLASKMPQAKDADPVNDLALDAAPDTWLPGFPNTGVFTTYEKIRLTLDQDDPDAEVWDLHNEDEAKWDEVRRSSRTAVHYYWAPDTKVIGMLDFAGNRVYGTSGAHGAMVASVSVGNDHGTCPECLLVFISYSDAASAEAAIEWAMDQPWIDAITNSYGFSFQGRDRLYSGSDVEAQRTASERGQTIFFSAGNGLQNDFLIPNSTLFSSQEGPDWIITVGGTSPDDGNYTGTGKPADVSGIALDYPSIGGSTVTGTDTFGGTSNATPVVAGLYARSLWWARQRLDGASRVQSNGVVATGTPVTCGTARPDCELADGTLTAVELRTRLLRGAIHTEPGLEPGGHDERTPAIPEQEFAAEGHGTYHARFRSSDEWAADQARIIGPMDGSAALTPRPDGEADWFLVDSYCRQEIWGTWTSGFYQAGRTQLPPPSPLWPLRTALASSCSQLFPPVSPAGRA
jgi:hypothetical protein